MIESDISNIPVYSNIDDPSADKAQDTKHYKRILRTLSIPAPDGFWLALENDKSENNGDFRKRWGLN